MLAMGYAIELKVLLVVLLILWLSILVVRRRTRSGIATVQERRFESAIRTFAVELDAFKFAPQQAVKVLLRHDHVISEAIEKMEQEEKEDPKALRLRVYHYLEEIVPFFRPLMYYKVGYWISHSILNFLFKIEYDETDLQRIREEAAKGNRITVYVCNHRSNADFVILPYVLRDNVALSFAVGEWARVWPLDVLFKSFGSYFIRRGCRDKLYHIVLRRYVQLVTKNGVTQAMFPEGGLSRDGFLREPKLGLIDSMVTAKEDRSFQREIVFVPVAINYDRVLEDRNLIGELKPKKRKLTKLEMFGRVLKISFSNIHKFSRGEIRKNGIASLRFGKPMSFDAWQQSSAPDLFELDKYDRRRNLADFVNQIQEAIAKLVPVTPLTLVATVLHEHPQLTRDALVEQLEFYLERFEKAGATVVYRDRGLPWIADGALMRLGIRKIVSKGEETYRVTEDSRDLVSYYAKSVSHHLGEPIPLCKIPEYATKP